jgi:uncharacterized protein with HEPN domain
VRSDSDRAADILEAIGRIRSRTKTGKAAFVADEMLQVWVVHHLEIIGEAVKGLSQSYRDARPEVPWNLISAMRDRLAHNYWIIDKELVWEVVAKDLAKLKEAVTRAHS